jgi:DNA-binding NtrC family response regulator
MSDDSAKYHAAVARFKREFLQEALAAHNGNRTRTARTIGLQRTYLLSLIREFGLSQPGNGSRRPRPASLAR